MEVVVYSKPNCVQCVQTKEYLTKLGIEFNSVDVSQDQEAFAKVSGLGYRSVPVVFAGEDHWSGFQPAKMSSLSK